MLRPKWVFGHLLAVAVIVGFIALGFWQLRRLDERRDLNATIAARTTEAPAPLADLLVLYGEDVDALEYRRVEASGTYATQDEVIWQARTLDGRSGHDVLTPLVSGTRALIVNRGWVPIDASDPPVAGAEPPEGRVVVAGIVRRGQVRGSVGPRDPADGDLDRISRVDIGRLQAQIDPTLYPFYLVLENQTPAQSGAVPVLRPMVDLEEGRHLNYAIQWFLFAAIVVVGYPLLLRRTAGDEPKENSPLMG